MISTNSPANGVVPTGASSSRSSTLAATRLAGCATAYRRGVGAIVAGDVITLGEMRAKGMVCWRLRVVASSVVVGCRLSG